MSQIEKLQFFQEIVDTKSFKEHDGMIVDLFTASYVLQIYNILNEQNKSKFFIPDIQGICNLAMHMAHKFKL